MGFSKRLNEIFSYFTFIPRKQCIVSDQRFHFLKDLVRSLPDVNSFDEDGAPSASNSTTDPEENLR